MYGWQESSYWRCVYFKLEKPHELNLDACTYTFTHMQSIPDGNPGFMAADFSKLDLPKLTADAAKYPNAGVPIERMEFWSNLESRLHELHQMPDSDVAEHWLSELEDKKITPVEDLAPPAISQQVINACVKDRQPIPEVC